MSFYSCNISEKRRMRHKISPVSELRPQEEPSSCLPCIRVVLRTKEDFRHDVGVTNATKRWTRFAAQPYARMITTKEFRTRFITPLPVTWLAAQLRTPAINQSSISFNYISRRTTYLTIENREHFPRGVTVSTSSRVTEKISLIKNNFGKIAYIFFVD